MANQRDQNQSGNQNRNPSQSTPERDQNRTGGGMGNQQQSDKRTTGSEQSQTGRKADQNFDVNEWKNPDDVAIGYNADVDSSSSNRKEDVQTNIINPGAV